MLRLVSEEKFSLEENKKNTGSCENCEELLLVLLWTLELVLSFYTKKKKKFCLKCYFSFFSGLNTPLIIVFWLGMVIVMVGEVKMDQGRGKYSRNIQFQVKAGRV